MAWVPTVSATLTVPLAFGVARRIFGLRTAVLTLPLLLYLRSDPGQRLVGVHAVQRLEPIRVGEVQVLELDPTSVGIAGSGRRIVTDVLVGDE